MPRQKLTKRSDGRFKVKYHDKQFYGKTQSEALRKRDEWIAAERAGFNHEFETITFRDYAIRWLDVYKADCGQSQKKQYIGFVHFAAERLGNGSLKEITATDLQALVNLLTPYSPSYVNKFMQMMRGIFKAAAADGAILRNPMDTVKRPKTKKCVGHRALEPWERELIVSTCHEHDFGLCMMVMLFAGLRRGEALYLDVDRDVDFEQRTITVRGAVSFSEGNQATFSPGKTEAAQRTIPLVAPLAEALRGHHGLLCTKQDGGLMSETAFQRKMQSYITFLETQVNGCRKRWYGKTRAHKALLTAGRSLPPWQEVTIRCHDLRVDFCTRAYQAQIPLKTLQAWMGHADAQMILQVYAKLTQQQEQADAMKLAAFMNQRPLPERICEAPCGTIENQSEPLVLAG